MEARIWASAFKSISKEFQKQTGINLSKGLKILIEATVNFHERYGISLVISNVDPTYTVGEMARRRKEIIERLTAEGLINKNKTLPFPIVAQHIAVISSARAAGYEDFVKHLSSNIYGYVFYPKLYPAVMQGDEAQKTILDALSKCEDNRDLIDAVVIVRGGGGSIDLDCFDSYEIGRKIALMSIPVISGIGHERDKSVVDEVSHTIVKTPTAAAALIIETAKAFEDKINALQQNLIDSSRAITNKSTNVLMSLSSAFASIVRASLLKHKYETDGFINALLGSKRIVKHQSVKLENGLEKLKLLSIKGLWSGKTALVNISNSLTASTKRLLQKQDDKLNSMTGSVKLLDPANVLKRGYSITFHKGKSLKTAQKLNNGDIIKTVLYEGEVESSILKKKTSELVNQQQEETDEDRTIIQSVNN
ncbi:Exodeoxyribonuclease VII large subunit [Candidatus Magnetoovum chiemensis]|nr:Exodeoxyribonuclease VII large subunit [Candidatus Magnetoovum chiemensis]